MMFPTVVLADVALIILVALALPLAIWVLWPAWRRSQAAKESREDLAKQDKALDEQIDELAKQVQAAADAGEPLNIPPDDIDQLMKAVSSQTYARDADRRAKVRSILKAYAGRSQRMPTSRAKVANRIMSERVPDHDAEADADPPLVSRIAGRSTLVALHALWVGRGGEDDSSTRSFERTIVSELAQVESDPDLGAFWNVELSPKAALPSGGSLTIGAVKCVELIARHSPDELAIRYRLLDISRICLPHLVASAVAREVDSSLIDEIILHTARPTVRIDSDTRAYLIVPQLGAPLDDLYAHLYSTTFEPAGLFMVVHTTQSAAVAFCDMWEQMHIDSRNALKSRPEVWSVFVPAALRIGLMGSFRYLTTGGTDESVALGRNTVLTIMPPRVPNNTVA